MFHKPMEHNRSYLHPHAVLGSARCGTGLFAGKVIPKNTIIIDWACSPGVLMTSEEAYKYEADGNYYTLQVGDDEHLVSVDIVEPCDYINHSCSPNCGIRGRYQVCTMRTVQTGEELTFDYAMSESSDLFRLSCNCGSEECRKLITGSDWMIPELQKRYGEFFSGYILTKLKLSSSQNSPAVQVIIQPSDKLVSSAS